MTIDQVELHMEKCADCHILFWISKKHHNNLVESKETFCCPNGHNQSYTGKTDKQKLKEALEEKERMREYWDKASERSSEYYEKWIKSKKELKKLQPEKVKKKEKTSKGVGKQGGINGELSK